MTNIVFFIIIGEDRHDIISNEIRTNLTINLLMNSLIYLMSAVPTVLHFIHMLTFVGRLVLVSVFNIL